MLQRQVLTLTVLSHPQETSRRSGLLGGLAESRQPGGVADAQDTAIAPIACALSIWTTHAAMAPSAITEQAMLDHAGSPSHPRPHNLASHAHPAVQTLSTFRTHSHLLMTRHLTIEDDLTNQRCCQANTANGT